MTEVEQKRQHTRVDVRMGAEIQTGGDVFTAITQDISVGGARLECERAVHEGDNVRLSLFLVYDGIEDERMPPLVVGARVQWVAETDEGALTAGFRFEGISQAQTDWLARVLKVTEA